jgi:hypothetical protein
MKVKNGLVAGFVATVVLSLVLMLKNAMGWMPGLSGPTLLAAVAGQFTGTPPSPVVGWALHFFLGTVVWGLVYAAIEPRLKGPPLVRGLVFGGIVWTAVAIVAAVALLPALANGLLGPTLGLQGPLATLLLHLLFGVVLGVVYARSGSAAAIDDVTPA